MQESALRFIKLLATLRLCPSKRFPQRNSTSSLRSFVLGLTNAKTVLIDSFRCQDGGGVSKLHSARAVHSQVQRTGEPQQRRGHAAHLYVQPVSPLWFYLTWFDQQIYTFSVCVWRSVEVPVSAAAGVPGSDCVGRADGVFRLSLSKPHPCSLYRNSSPFGW